MSKSISVSPSWVALSWRDLFAATAAADETSTLQLEQNFASELGRRLIELVHEGKLNSISSHAVFDALAIGDLNAYLASMDVSNAGSAHLSLVSLNNVIHMAPDAVAAALAEHGTVEALTRGVHKRIDLQHDLSPLVMLVLHAMCARCESVYGHVDVMATKQDLIELVVGAVMWLGNTPEQLRTGMGLDMANRAVQICWSMTKFDTSASSTVTSLFVTVDLAGRTLQLAGLLSKLEFLESLPAEGSSLGEQCVGLAGVCSSFAAVMLGLGGALDASAAGLHRLRSWLLRRGHLADVHSTLSLLTHELLGTGPLLAHVRQQQQAAELSAEGATAVAPSAAAGDAVSPASTSDAASSDAAATGTSSESSLSALHVSIEGALRNLLTCLGVPLLCADPGQQSEVTALSSFALQYCFLLFQEGFADIFKLLSNRASPYRGPYLTFFCAMSDLLQEGMMAIGPQFAEWGVQLDKTDGDDAASLFVPTPSGTDSATATAFITQQVTSCVGWSQRMRKIIQLSQRAALSRAQVQKAVGGTQQSSAAAKAAGSGGSHAAACAFCGLEAGARQLKACACGLTSYCDKTCQVAHFPQHKAKCKAARQLQQQATK